MKLARFLIAVLAIACLMAGCGDGPDKVQPGRTLSPSVRPTVQNSPSYTLPEAPCASTEFVVATPKLPYTLKFNNPDTDLESFNGVMINACMGQKDPGRKASMEILAKGVQKWLEKEYPNGASEAGQLVFEEKVCKEIARLMSEDRELAKITWILLGTSGSYTLKVYGVGTPLPTTAPQGKYVDATCKLPKLGPQA